MFDEAPSTSSNDEPAPESSAASAASANSLAFLDAVLPAEGWRCMWAKKVGEKPKQTFHKNNADLEAQLKAFDAKGWDAYFCTSTLKQRGNRKATNVHALRAFRLDADVKAGAYATAREAAGAVLALLLPLGLQATLVKSGYGLHVYIVLNEAIPPEQWLPAARALDQRAKAAGLLLDHGVTIDPVRILRPPYTCNRKKPESPQPVTLLNGPLTNPTAAVLNVLGAPGPVGDKPARHAPKDHARSSGAPSSFLGDMHGPQPPASAAIAAQHCAQLARMRDTRRGNGIWYHLLGVLGYCDMDGDALAQDWSAEHKNYTPQETAQKLARQRAETSGPTLCATLERLNPASCQSCQYRGTVATPVQLGRAGTLTTGQAHPAAGAPALTPSHSPNEVELRRLAALPWEAYEIQRKDAAKRLEIRVDALDKMVKQRRPDDGHQDRQGVALGFPAIEPWPDAVDGADMLEQLASIYRRHCALRPHVAAALALWTAHAYAIEATPISPRLVIMSPERRCGKTTVLSLLYFLTPRPLKCESATVAAIFRTVDKFHPTLLLDEFDAYAVENEELRGIVNSGHRSDGAVIRVVGEDHEPRQFRTYAATAIASIGRVPGTIEDRAVIVRLRRRTPSEPIERLRTDRPPPDLEDARRRAARWADDSQDRLLAADPAVPADLHDRAADNWRSLLAIADEAGGHWPETARSAALALSGGADGEGQSKAVQLLGDIRDIFGTLSVIASKDLVGLLTKLEDRPWATWSRGFGITPAQIAKLLSDFEIHPRQIWVEGPTGKIQVRGYGRGDFTDAFTRYLTLHDSGKNPSK